ncbi:MAG: MBOAT family O-acyltransferase [Bradymonadia bacterium]
MLFHTLDYIIFLPLTVYLYWLSPRSWRLGILAASSVLFYASWNVFYLPILLGVVGLAWFGGVYLGRQAGGPSSHPLARAGLLIALLLPLLACKYWSWIADNIDWVVGAIKGEHSLAWVAANIAGLVDGTTQTFALPRLDVQLPVGISFFTFQALAYVIDVQRAARDEKPLDEHGKPIVEANLLRFGTFLAFFPQLVAGPIVRRHELMPQLRNLGWLRKDDVAAGLWRIMLGLFKKVVIADAIRRAIADPVFEDPSGYTGLEVWVALYAYTLQIYYDFSAYTDIAIGSARLFGIDLPENFRRPYKALSVAAFWRRWHITLSNWVRDYIYFPLGGGWVKGGQWKIYRNLMATMLIIGIWHGASWNFVVYGTLHGIAQCVCRWNRKRTGRKPDAPAPHLWGLIWRFMLTFHFVVVARILFRARDLTTSWEMFVGLGDIEWLMPRFSPTAFAVLFIGYAIHFSPESWRDDLGSKIKGLGPVGWAIASVLVGAACLMMSTGEHLGFVYYKF